MMKYIEHSSMKTLPVAPVNIRDIISEVQQFLSDARHLKGMGFHPHVKAGRLSHAIGRVKISTGASA
jgi:hypothetical protein